MLRSARRRSVHSHDRESIHQVPSTLTVEPGSVAINKREKTMTRRALIVDDEPTMCELIQSVLSSTGMASLTLTKSSDATAFLRDEKFDVVLLDLCMPAPDGIALAQQARTSGFNQMTPIIMISDDPRPSA